MPTPSRPDAAPEADGRRQPARRSRPSPGRRRAAKPSAKPRRAAKPEPRPPAPTPTPRAARCSKASAAARCSTAGRAAAAAADGSALRRAGRRLRRCGQGARGAQKLEKPAEDLHPRREDAEAATAPACASARSRRGRGRQGARQGQGRWLCRPRPHAVRQRADWPRLDWVAVALLALSLSVLVGLVRGLVFEVLSLAGWVVAFVRRSGSRPTSAPCCRSATPGSRLGSMRPASCWCSSPSLFAWGLVACADAKLVAARGCGRSTARSARCSAWRAALVVLLAWRGGGATSLR